MASLPGDVQHRARIAVPPEIATWFRATGLTSVTRCCVGRNRALKSAPAATKRTERRRLPRHHRHSVPTQAMLKKIESQPVETGHAPACLRWARGSTTPSGAPVSSIEDEADPEAKVTLESGVRECLDRRLARAWTWPRREGCRCRSAAAAVVVVPSHRRPRAPPPKHRPPRPNAPRLQEEMTAAPPPRSRSGRRGGGERCSPTPAWASAIDAEQTLPLVEEISDLGVPQPRRPGQPGAPEDRTTTTATCIRWPSAR